MNCLQSVDEQLFRCYNFIQFPAEAGISPDEQECYKKYSKIRKFNFGK